MQRKPSYSKLGKDRQTLAAVEEPLFDNPGNLSINLNRKPYKPPDVILLRAIRKKGSKAQGQRADQLILEWQYWGDLAQKAGLSIGLWDWDFASNTVFWSDETYQQFGFTLENFSGRAADVLDRIHPEDRRKVEEAMQKVVAGRQEWSLQFRIVRPDGTTRWIDSHGRMARTASKARMLGVGIDITNYKVTEQSRRESEEKYHLVLNSAAEGICGLDLLGNCTFCNPACVRLLGFESSDELLGRDMSSHLRLPVARSAAPGQSNREILDALHEPVASHFTDELFWRADGTSFPVECWFYPMRLDGIAVGSVVTFVDISSRKNAEQEVRQSERKYRELFENAPHGIFLANQDGTLLDVNPALVSMLRYASREELLLCNLNRDIYENPSHREAILAVLGATDRVDSVEVPWKRKDGKSISVRLSGRRVRGMDGEISHLEVIAEDITERRDLEAQLRQAQRMEAVGQLAGGVSHDLNNHLGVILGNVELLLEKMASPELQYYGLEVKNAAAKATQLTRQLLAFSRKQVLNPIVLNLNAVINDVGSILRRLIGEDVRIEIDEEKELSSIRADRGQIEQILMNLATNARDAMPNGGTFRIQTENCELGAKESARYPYVQPGKFVHLAVSDTGTGMTEEVRLRAFEPFFTTKPQGRGTGLGLATVYGIVKQSGGYIWITSVSGQGARFDIYLPQVEEAPQAHAGSSIAQAELPGGTETIIVVEDEEPLRRVTCEFLTASGYIVLQAGNGAQALELAARYEEPINLVVSDVILPDMDGPSVVAKVKELHPEVKSLFVSGYTEVPTAKALIASGVVLLHKPVTRSEFMSSVDQILHPNPV